jgi:hypothetical protein
MNNSFWISRRKFGKILIFSTLTAIAGESLEAATAQPRLGSKSNLIYGITTIPGSNQLSLLTLDLKTKAIKTLLSPIPEVILNVNERVTSFSRLSNQLFLIAIAPTIADAQADSPRLAVFSPESLSTATQSNVLALPEFSASDSIESIVNPQGDELWLLVRKTNQQHHGKPQLLSYDASAKETKGQMIAADTSVPPLRVLSLSPNSKQLYGVSLHGTSHHGGTSSLWQGNLQTHQFQKLTDLSFKKETWGTGFRSLVCSESEVLYGLGTEGRNDFNDVYELNPKTGEMKYINRFDVMNIAV